jgi:hypothetical protein
MQSSLILRNGFEPVFLFRASVLIGWSRHFFRSDTIAKPARRRSVETTHSRPSSRAGLADAGHFPCHFLTRRGFAGCRRDEPGVAEMGVGDQFACASLVAAFSIALFVTANLFVESRASRPPTVMPAQYARVSPL